MVSRFDEFSANGWYQRFTARVFSSVTLLSCRKETISDELSAVRTLEVAGFGFREVVETVPEVVFPPGFKFVAMFGSQCTQGCVRRR